MAQVVLCPRCLGEGRHEWTKELGGPKCNECWGAGFYHHDLVVMRLASMLDGNSVYMSGPSQASRQKARKIVDELNQLGVLMAPKQERETDE
jgi:DnaJ-class molecular chaperone